MNVYIYIYIYELTGLHIVRIYSKSIVAYSLLLHRRNIHTYTETHNAYTERHTHTHRYTLIPTHTQRHIHAHRQRHTKLD